MGDLVTCSVNELYYTRETVEGVEVCVWVCVCVWGDIYIQLFVFIQILGPTHQLDELHKTFRTFLLTPSHPHTTHTHTVEATSSDNLATTTEPFATDTGKDCEADTDGGKDCEADTGRGKDCEADTDGGKDREADTDRGKDCEGKDCEADMGRGKDCEADTGRGKDREADTGRGKDREADTGRGKDREADTGRGKDREATSGDGLPTGERLVHSNIPYNTVNEVSTSVLRIHIILSLFSDSLRACVSRPHWTVAQLHVFHQCLT